MSYWNPLTWGTNVATMSLLEPVSRLTAAPPRPKALGLNAKHGIALSRSVPGEQVRIVGLPGYFLDGEHITEER